jgi:hypothetical protein
MAPAATQAALIVVHGTRVSILVDVRNNGYELDYSDAESLQTLKHTIPITN